MVRGSEMQLRRIKWSEISNLRSAAGTATAPTLDHFRPWLVSLIRLRFYSA